MLIAKEEPFIISVRKSNKEEHIVNNHITTKDAHRIAKQVVQILGSMIRWGSAAA